MVKIIKLNLYCIFCLLFMLSSKQSVGMITDTPTVVAGIVKITGRIISPNDRNKDSIFVNFYVPHPISGENVQYRAFADQSGKFSIDIDVETSISNIGIYTSINRYKSIYVKLTSGNVTNIDIAYNSNNDIENINITPAVNQNDMTKGLEVMGKMIEYMPNRAPKPLYNKSVDYFLKHAKTNLSERLEIVKNDTLISKELKEVLSKEIRLFLYSAFVFDYKGQMMHNYRNTGDDKSKMPDIQKIDKSYYRFLRDFNFNDPQYLMCATLAEVQNKILQNEIIDLPVIGESDIPTWLAKVKVILSDLVGFNEGSYYDILAANAYTSQLNEEVRPLSEKQKENIINYWQNGEIAKILFRKNQQVVEFDKFKSPAVVNDVSTVSEEKVIETIVSKYKGKVIFIDLWAMWCGPCLDAMQEFRAIKHDFHDRDVVFVYITNTSSPQKRWEKIIKGIGDEHYYLKSSQWEYIMDHFGFEGIPSYLLYNKEGVLINKFTAFPGNEEVKAMINGLL